MPHVRLNPAQSARIGRDRDIGMKRDPSTEQYSRKAAPYYAPSRSAIVQVAAGGICRTGFDEGHDGPCITKIKGIDEKQEEHNKNDGDGGEQKERIIRAQL